VKNFPKINLAQDALHGMAYYIFLKSLRSIEEFRKNPHVKIHIFPTTTPNSVILVPKFLESLSLSFYAFIFHMFVVFID
jgi:hypothetical protein